MRIWQHPLSAARTAPTSPEQLAASLRAPAAPLTCEQLDEGVYSEWSSRPRQTVFVPKQDLNGGGAAASTPTPTIRSTRSVSLPPQRVAKKGMWYNGIMGTKTVFPAIAPLGCAVGGDFDDRRKDHDVALVRHNRLHRRKSPRLVTRADLWEPSVRAFRACEAAEARLANATTPEERVEAEWAVATARGALRSSHDALVAAVNARAAEAHEWMEQVEALEAVLATLLFEAPIHSELYKEGGPNSPPRPGTRPPRPQRRSATPALATVGGANRKEVGTHARLSRSRLAVEGAPHSLRRGAAAICTPAAA